MDSIQVSCTLQSIINVQPMQWHCTGTVSLKHVSFFFKIGIQPLIQKFECNVFQSSLLRKFFLYPRIQQQAVYKSIHSFLTPHVPLSMPHVFINQVRSANLSHSPCKINAWMPTTCFTSMYKNMYNSKSKMILLLLLLLLLSSIATMLAKNQDVNKRKQEDWRSESKRSQEIGQTLIFPKTTLCRHILNTSTHSLFGAWLFLLVHIWFTPSEGPQKLCELNF